MPVVASYRKNTSWGEFFIVYGIKNTGKSQSLNFTFSYSFGVWVKEFVIFDGNFALFMPHCIYYQRSRSGGQSHDASMLKITIPKTTFLSNLPITSANLSSIPTKPFPNLAETSQQPTHSFPKASHTSQFCWRGL